MQTNADASSLLRHTSALTSPGKIFTKCRKDEAEELSLAKKSVSLYPNTMDYSQIYIRIRLDRAVTLNREASLFHVQDTPHKQMQYLPRKLPKIAELNINQPNPNEPNPNEENTHDAHTKPQLNCQLSQFVPPKSSPQAYSIHKVYSIANNPTKVKPKSAFSQQSVLNEAKKSDLQVEFQSNPELNLPESQAQESPLALSRQKISQAQSSQYIQIIEKADQVLIAKTEEREPISLSNFKIERYSECHKILTSIQTALKANKGESQVMLREIKKYLQMVASGEMDSLDEFNFPLHKKKTIKLALGYERVSVVILAFAVAKGIVPDALKYLNNLMTYSLHSNTLLLNIFKESGDYVHRVSTKRNLDSIRNNNEVLAESLFKISKLDEGFHERFKEQLKNMGRYSLEQAFYQILEFFAFFLCISDLSSTMPFLAVAPNPYLQPSKLPERYTLVIDTVEVFCHGTKKSKTHVFRPHTEHFLREMSQYYEIVSFSNAYPNQIDRVIDLLDNHHHIQHRLYRHHFVQNGRYLLKDRDRMGRELGMMISLQSQSGGDDECSIKVPAWRGNKSDTSLAELCPVLVMIALKRMDCEVVTRKIQEQRRKNTAHGIKYLNFGMNFQ